MIEENVNEKSPNIKNHLPCSKFCLASIFHKTILNAFITFKKIIICDSVRVDGGVLGGALYKDRWGGVGLRKNVD